RPGEEGVVGCCHPLGQGRTRAGGSLPFRFLAVEETRLDYPLLSRDLDLAALPLRRQVGEEPGILPELSPCPLGEGVVVTLGALQLDAEEQSGRAASEVLRLVLVGLVED